MLNTTNAMATKMPQPEMVLMHTNNDNDTVRKTRRTIVRSCGTCYNFRCLMPFARQQSGIPMATMNAPENKRNPTTNDVKDEKKQ